MGKRGVAIRMMCVCVRVRVHLSESLQHNKENDRIASDRQDWWTDVTDSSQTCSICDRLSKECWMARLWAFTVVSNIKRAEARPFV